MKRVQPVDRFHGRTLGECSSLVFSNPLYSPDNIPIALTMGNCVILKPSEKVIGKQIMDYGWVNYVLIIVVLYCRYR